MEKIVYIFALHWFADYFLQPYWIKVGKVNNFSILFLHVIIYSAALFLGLYFFVGAVKALKYGLLNGLLHLAVDFLTSKIISKNSSSIEINPDRSMPLYKRINIYIPVLFLGFDQLLHQACLILTLPMLS